MGKAQALSCKALSTKIPNFGTEMTGMILEVALALGGGCYGSRGRGAGRTWVGVERESEALVGYEHSMC